MSAVHTIAPGAPGWSCDGASGPFTMDAQWLPFHPQPARPVFRAPPGAVDAHCHVFGPGAHFPYAPERRYTPCDAPKEKLWALRDYLGFERNVLVQATCHGTDNRALVDALHDAQGRARGVACGRVTRAGLSVPLRDVNRLAVAYRGIGRIAAPWSPGFPSRCSR